tara:strand:+ start:126 stop:602 length:477 start_codon:yes stop_codon:yes gene_type:complete
MLISCENCNKKFEVSEDLIPDQGRLLQCSSCDYKWFFKNVIKDHKASKIKPIFKENKDEISSFEPSQDLSNVKKQHTIESAEEIQITKQEQTTPIKKDKELNYFKIFLVFIISIVALIVLIDTFKHQISSVFPGTETILFNLYESLTDINLFIRDLIK